MKTNKKEILPEDIWNKKDRSGIREYIKEHAKKQTTDQRLKTELASIQYQLEDYLTSDEISSVRSVHDFVKMYLKTLRMSMSEFAEIIEMKSTNLYKYTRGDRKLNADIVCKISAFSHTEPELWFYLEAKNNLIGLRKDTKKMKAYEKYKFENYLFHGNED